MSYDWKGKFKKFGDPSINGSKNIAKTQNKLETTITYKLRPENALDFYKVFKMDLLNIP